MIIVRLLLVLKIPEQY